MVVPQLLVLRLLSNIGLLTLFDSCRCEHLCALLCVNVDFFPLLLGYLWEELQGHLVTEDLPDHFPNKPLSPFFLAPQSVVLSHQGGSSVFSARQQGWGVEK